MIALYIVFTVLLLLFIVAILPVSLCVKYKDEVSLSASVLAFKFFIYPKKKERVKISDYSKKKLEKQKKKAIKKRLKKKSKSALKKSQKNPAAKKELSISEKLELVYKLLKESIGQAAKRVKIKTQKIVITIGSDDAAKTAMLYAAASNAVLLILTLLDNCKKLKGFKGSEIAVNADFTAQKCSADLEIIFSMRVWQLLKSLFAVTFKYLKDKEHSK